MKKYIQLICLMLLFITVSQFVYAQSPTPEDQAGKIAQRMKDSLNLTTQQREGIYSVSLSLIQQSRDVFAQAPPADSLQPRLQRIENTRDKLYLPVLGNEKYLLYKEKKRALVFAN